MLAIVKRTGAGRRETLAVALVLEEAKIERMIRAERLLIAYRIQEAKSLEEEGQF